MATKQTTLPANDRVLETAAEMKRLQDRFNTLSCRRGGSDVDLTYRTSEKDDLSERIEILRDYLSAAQASSLGGAVAQVRELHLITDMMSCSIDYENQAMRLRRLLFSIDAVLTDMLPAGIQDQIVKMGAYLNPWTPHEQRVASIGEKE